MTCAGCVHNHVDAMLLWVGWSCVSMLKAGGRHKWVVGCLMFAGVGARFRLDSLNMLIR